MQSGIYKIRCIVSGKIYVGSAVNLAARWSAHRHLLRKGKHNSIHLQRAFDKHGADAFMFEIIEHVTELSDLIAREQFYIDQLQPFGANGYNIAPLAGHTLGAKRTPEQIERMAARFRGRKLSQQHRDAISRSQLGRRHSDESKLLMREARLKNNHQVGRPMTDAQKLALHRSGKDHPWFGRSHSPETIMLLSKIRSTPIEQVLPDGSIKYWPTAKQAAVALGLKSADSIYRAICSPARKAAGTNWRQYTNQAIIS